jgi:hypothetical protein
MSESGLRACAVALALLVLASPACAGALIAPGDVALRDDIQRLADHGIIQGPVTSWPLAWGAILSDIEQADGQAGLPYPVVVSLARVRERALREARVGGLMYTAKAAAAEAPVRMRSFADTPRESGEIGAGLSWTGNLLSISLQGQAVTSPQDGKEYRADGSMIGVALGNYTIAASTTDRWWGPGWDGSLILSSNARPIPALTIDRNFTDAFDTKWLSWLGPWDVGVVFGRMENARTVPEAQFFGFRFNFRPLASLEVGLSRTAQWCGEGRPCSLDTFKDLLLGRDNRGDGIDGNNEPGNQLAGLDFRWNTMALKMPFAVYGQFIGEDEAGGFPSRYLGQLGAETAGLWKGFWSYRLFGEFAATTCGFYESGEMFDCAYNHSIYQTGYRYRGRVVGHGGDNDARIFSGGLSLIDNETRWQALLRFGELNRGGALDAGNSLTPTKQDILSFDLSLNRIFRYGVVEIGTGIERIDDAASNRADNDVRAFIQWRSAQ